MGDKVGNSIQDWESIILSKPLLSGRFIFVSDLVKKMIQ